jgi:hypothetical protein
MIPLINLREIDKKRLRNLKDRVETNLKSEECLIRRAPA